MNPLLEQFLSEAREALEGIGEKLMQLEAAPDEQALMTELFRLVHTLKGNSGLFDFPEMTRVLHAGEDLMDAVRNGEVRYSQALADCLLDAMDFVGLLCDDAEAQRPVDAAMARQAVALAQALRQLMGSDAQAPASDALAPLAAATAGQLALADPAWLAKVPERVMAPALQAASAGADLFWLHYVPNEECFFQGEDPLHQARHTPGFLWGGMAARAPWPALPQMDAYRCMLDFAVLTSAPEEAVRAHYRYVPEQITLYAVARPAAGTQAGALALPVAAAAQAPGLGEEALQNLLQVQREVLSLPDDAQWLAGRIKAAVACLSGCLRATGRAAEIAALQAVAQQALAAASAQALAAWMALAFPAPEEEALAQTRATEPVVAAPESQAPPASDSPEPEQKFGRRAEDSTAPKSLKVDQDKIDRLMNLIGEMVVAKNAIPYLANRAETVFGVRELSREIKTHYAVINRISEEMQDAIMQVRMMPVSFVFQRFPRLVRDTSRRLGKEVNLVFEGQDTAADKNIIEALGDPLVHIVRNSLDHGLEAADVRMAAGKPAMGTLKIAARQESDRVVLEISDDGKGIDPQVIKTKAYQKGLIDEHVLDRISDQEAVNLVFAPGFSTAEVVSDLSGRGVGMDVVRNAIERVNGQIMLESVKGQGTLIRLTLPLSMAVTTVMTVESDGQRFGVPMDRVVETVRVPRSQVRSIKQSMATVLRERILPLRSLNSILGLAAPPLSNDNDELATLVVRVGDDTLGILVDDFHETADIILKPLGGVLAGMRSYAGSALMGDGSVLMVLDVKEMV
jgi:two-component system chemotaxis sensor kinase CheA